ncbi:hypothetical protein NUU61_000565 [Penicillium alfredii]|uniref:Uncharacterized protein n=1 Tax=Penicillium alfredii TaxID=1506179 RepID=A0A9W9G9W2_9EURO|nr:uncharacterized protein NUU61_000565 [Penicillium alfredii]KAJ5114806.1 hypothetical protein NUU61_000565 [Penicillium alfredii]
MRFPLTLTVLSLSLSLFCVASSRLGQKDAIAALRTRDKPPPNGKPPHLKVKKVLQGEAFWYYGFEKDSYWFNFYEHLWEQLVEVVNLVGNSGFSDDIFKTWFSEIEGQVVEKMLEVIREKISPRCEADNSPKIWIVAGDPDNQCGDKTVAYSKSVSYLNPRPKQMDPGDFTQGKTGDYYMAFCGKNIEARPYLLDCSAFQSRKFAKKDMPLVFTMLHELGHFEFIGNKVLNEFPSVIRSSKISKMNGLGFAVAPEVYDPEFCSLMANEADKTPTCKIQPTRNPDNYAWFALVR